MCCFVPHGRDCDLTTAFNGDEGSHLAYTGSKTKTYQKLILLPKISLRKS